MSKFHYVTPDINGDFITCDWNEGDNHLADRQGLHLDKYVRGNLESQAYDAAINILEIPSSLNLKLTAGSDAGILMTLLYSSSQSSPSFRMRKNDYAQVRAFAELSFKFVDVVDDESIFSDIKPGSLIYLSNPGNPTCKCYSDIELLEVVKGNSESLFIIDLAYIEFEDSFDLSIFEGYKNVVFFRTFSKFWGIAGARLGAIIYPLNSQLSPLYQTLNSKNLTRQHIALLNDLQTEKLKIVQIRNEEKIKLTEIGNIIKSKFDVNTSRAGNFIRFDCPNSEVKFELEGYFNDLLITVRDLSHLAEFENSLRFSYREKAYQNILL